MAAVLPRAVIPTVNLAEVATKLGDLGADAEEARALLAPLHLVASLSMRARPSLPGRYAPPPAPMVCPSAVELAWRSLWVGTRRLSRPTGYGGMPAMSSAYGWSCYGRGEHRSEGATLSAMRPRTSAQSARETRMIIPKNAICLWFEKDAEAAAQFHASTFPDSAVGAGNNSGDPGSLTRDCDIPAAAPRLS